MHLILRCLAAVLILSLPALAQDEGSLLDQLTAAQQSTATPTAPDVLFPDMPQGYAPSTETLEAIDTSLRGYYDYRIVQYEHRLAVFKWQYLSSQVIFYVVIAIVLIGLYFSWMQFHRDQIGDAPPAVTEISAKKDGFSVSSPVLGVIILVLSLGFFYLYLVHVYPISETF
ncbi:hypothetical protein [Jannaschia pohangensis]|uniref:Uncharacterized protein n=1 Tax=Jannaschia pohangensis TaxID=390807 RepID=A0A1I3HJL6_9RHOB|nr:hypothetical protein [Jannaschia pohangensis]SFI35925.1 hypothetical protein SAMN04488095_0625 [Jannaschia pohangensis]